MEENNRLNRRTKTRPPYDLRRKVLLKNFLREQMSPIPLQTSIESLVNHELADTSDNEIVDIENYESTSTEMILGSSSNALNLDSSNNALNLDSSKNAVNFDSANDSMDPLNSTEISSTDMEIDSEDSSENEHNRSFSFKSSLKFDFTKITESKLSRFKYLKKKTPSLSTEAVKNIADKNSVHFENKKRQNENVTARTYVKESKHNSYAPPWKRNPTIEVGKKRGIIKAKIMMRSFKQQQVDKSAHGSKSSNLNKVRKIIVAFHNAIRGDSPKVENFSATENHLDDPKGKPPHYTNKDPRHSGNRFSNFDLFTKENDENDADIPERVRMMKAIKKRQYYGKFDTPYEESSRRSGLKNSNSFVCKLLRRKTFNRNAGSELKEQDRPWSNSDISWSLNEIRKLEKANKRLREENKLLSESLSSIMADVDISLKTPPKPSGCAYNPHQLNNNESFTSKQESNLFHAVSDTPRCKVLRSRSVQDRGERRREIKSRLSSRSMCHQQYSRIPPRTLYRAKPCIINPYPTDDDVTQPYPELPPILSATSDRNCAKPISRRFSMLESISKRPHVNRRSSFTYEYRTHNRQNLLSLPTEAFY